MEVLMIWTILKYACRCTYCSITICCIIVALLLTFSNKVCGQVPELSFTYYSKGDGLASSNIFDLMQDSSGYIWIGTNNGLDKFDGYNFVHYKSTFTDSISLPNNLIQKLLVDSKGKLWVATNHGICTYNKQKNWFNRIPAPEIENGIGDYNFKKIIEDKNGHIIALTDKNIYRFDTVLKKFKHLYKLENSTGNLIYADDKNNFWIGTNESGIIKINKDGKLITTYIKGQDKNSLNCNSIFDLVIWKNKLWIATMGGGINVLDLNTNKITALPITDIDEVYSIFFYVDNFNQLWTIDFKGLKYFDKEQNHFVGYYPDEKNPYSIQSNVKAIFQDRQNNYWVLHEPGGVGVSTVPQGFRYFTSGHNNQWYTSDSKILSIGEDVHNNLWLGFASNGLNIFHWNTGKTERFKYNPDNPYSIGRGATLDILRDSKGVMWVSTYYSGLQYFDEKNRKFYTYSHNPNDPTSIACNDVRVICETSNGDLLLAVHGKGMDRFNKKTKRFCHYTKASNNLSNNWTFDILEDSKGNIWVATAWGLNVLKKGADTFMNYFHAPEDSTSLSDSFVLCLFEDSKHNLWVGTINGLNLYNEKDDNFTCFSEGMESNYICSILEDPQNYIWISTQEGISRLHYKTHTIENFDNKEGTRSGEFYPRSSFSSPSMGLMFGGIKGIDIIDINKLNKNTVSPNVAIHKFQLFNEEITNITHPELLENDISSTKSITLCHDQNTIIIGYVALNLINPRKNKYAYKLEGFDTRWNEVGTKREAVYTNLDPGKYIFRVIASNNDNVWSRKGASLEITILPPWYETTVFRALIFLVLTGLLILAYMFRTRQLRRQQAILKQKVTEKTEELLENNMLLEEKSENLREAYSLLIERQHLLEIQSGEMKKQSTNLENANKELQMLNNTKDKLFSIIAHDLTSPFNTILGFSDLFVQNYDKMSDKDRKRLAGIINSSSVKVFNLLQNLLLWARAQTKRINHIPENISLKSAITDILELLKAGITQKEISIEFSCPSGIMAYADIEMTKTIIRNLLNNAIKFTPKYGTINIVASNNQQNDNSDKKVFVSIQDSGVGMNQKIIDTILNCEPIMPGEGTEGEIGTGLGLTICNEFLKINQGELFIISSPGTGSEFKFSLPVAQKNRII